MSRGIYLVANRRVEWLAANLVYSIRRSGCTLPISLIPYDDDLPVDPGLLAEARLLRVEDFPNEARALMAGLNRLWPRTSVGLFRRFLAWYGPYDEFIYSDNDIVALGDWTTYLDHLEGFDLVHADEEYTTGGIFNYYDPSAIQREFGTGALDSLVTAGHFASRKKDDMTALFARTIAWIREHPKIAREHDQAFLHLALLLGGLRRQNLCQPPHEWPSPWAGDYRNTLDVVQAVQGPGRLLQLHYSGGVSNGYAAREELFFANRTDDERMRRLVGTALAHWSGLHYLRGQFLSGLKRRLGRLRG
jgi:hypothetical protein